MAGQAANDRDVRKTAAQVAERKNRIASGSDREYNKVTSLENALKRSSQEYNRLAFDFTKQAIHEAPLEDN